jgi:hypothetical protein
VAVKKISDYTEVDFGEAADVRWFLVELADGTFRKMSADTMKGEFLMSASYTADVEFDRPDNTTAYDAGDIVGGVLEFEDIGPPNGGEVTVSYSSLRVDRSTVPEGMTSFTLYLFSVTPPSALGDNDAYTLPSGDRAASLGTLDVGVPVSKGATLLIETYPINRPITVPAGGSLFAYLVTNGSFEPDAELHFKVDLKAFD